jgi:hypothetical protein
MAEMWRYRFEGTTYINKTRRIRLDRVLDEGDVVHDTGEHAMQKYKMSHNVVAH